MAARTKKPAAGDYLADAPVERPYEDARAEGNAGPVELDPATGELIYGGDGPEAEVAAPVEPPASE